MNKKDNIELTPEETERVNAIITGIQSDLNSAIEYLNKGDFQGALSFVKSGITKSNCPLCKRELGILIADITHNKEVCILESDMCEDERQVLINKAKELRDDFVPIKTTKRAIREKAKDSSTKSEKKRLELPLFPFIKLKKITK